MFVGGLSSCALAWYIGLVSITTRRPRCTAHCWFHDQVSGYDLLVDHSALHGDLDRVSNDLAARATTLASLSALCTAPRTASGELAHGHGGGEAGSMHGGEGGGVGGGGAAARLEGALRETRVLLNQTASALREYGGKLDSYLSYEYDYIQGMLHRMQVGAWAAPSEQCVAAGRLPRCSVSRHLYVAQPLPYNGTLDCGTAIAINSLPFAKVMSPRYPRYNGHHHHSHRLRSPTVTTRLRMSRTPRRLQWRFARLR